jgi:hypothetical protein
MRKRLNSIDAHQYDGMDKLIEQLTKILSRAISELHGEDLVSLKIVGAMPYPLRDDKYVVTYNLRLRGQPPIMLAKIVVDLAKGELEVYEPGLP